jgi:hypothetical protein
MSNPRIFVIILLSLALVYAVVVVANLSEAYIDFGDGNYLYISSRLADGLVLYRDIMAPQPPLHLYLGTLLVHLGRVIGEPLYTVRIFSLLLHLASMLLIFLIARRLFRSNLCAIVSSALYLVIPIGFYWSLGYQSEPLEMFFLLLSFYFFIGFEKRDMLFAAAFSALALFTNMTAVPYVLLNVLYLAVRRRTLLFYYLVPVLALSAAGVLLMQILTSEYLNNVFFNQVGTFPKREIAGETALHYAVRKILGEGRDVLAAESGFILVCIIGIIRFLRASSESAREYAALYAIASIGSIVFVSKGGTEDYIFTIGEPFVVLFAGYAVVTMLRFLRDRAKDSFHGSAAFIRNFLIIFVILYALLNLFVGVRYDVNTLRGRFYELPASAVKRIELYIREQTKPSDAILAQPYFAFISGRRLADEYSEHFIWKIMYWNEKLVTKRDGAAVALFNDLARKLSEKAIRLVILDLEQTATIPPVRAAIAANYKPLLGHDIRSRSFTFRLLVPR